MLASSIAALHCCSRYAAAMRHGLPGELSYAILHPYLRKPSSRYSNRCFKHQARRLHTTTSDDRISAASNRPQFAQAPYKILFAGSDRFSCTTLELLAKQDASLVKELNVLVPPDKRTSRGLKKIHRPPLRTLAETLDIPVHQVPITGLRDFTLPLSFTEETTLPGRNPQIASNLLITASFGYLIPQSMLAHFLPLNTLNVHPSLLPRYRGAAPIQWSIMDGENETGVTVQTLGKRFDEGRILAQRNVILKDPDYMSAEAELAQICAELLIDTLKDLRLRQEESKAQDPSQATYARKLTSVDAKIDWDTMTANEISRRHRGISHQYPVWTTVNDKRLQLLDVEETSAPQKMFDLRSRPGVGVLDKKNKVMIVQCKDDTWLAVRSLKTEGRKALSADSWWFGIVRGGQTVQFGP